MNTDKWQAWTDKIQQLVCEFVQNDHTLGELMLDHSEDYWDGCFEAGLTPEKALEYYIGLLQGVELFDKKSEQPSP